MKKLYQNLVNLVAAAALTFGTVTCAHNSYLLQQSESKKAENVSCVCDYIDDNHRSSLQLGNRDWVLNLECYGDGVGVRMREVSGFNFWSLSPWVGEPIPEYDFLVKQDQKGISLVDYRSVGSKGVRRIRAKTNLSKIEQKSAERIIEDSFATAANAVRAGTADKMVQVSQYGFSDWENDLKNLGL